MQPNDPINPDNQTNTQNPISPGDTISPLPPVNNIQASNEPTSIPVNTPSNTEAAPSQTSVNSDANISANIDANITTQPVQQDTTAPSQSYAAPMPDAQQNPNLTIVNNVPKQKKSPVAAIIIILLLILLAGGGAAAYFILGKKKTTMTDQQKNNNSTTTAETKTTTSTVPEGFKAYENKDLGIKFNYPSEWGEVTVTQRARNKEEFEPIKTNFIQFSNKDKFTITISPTNWKFTGGASEWDFPINDKSFTEATADTNETLIITKNTTDYLIIRYTGFDGDITLKGAAKIDIQKIPAQYVEFKWSPVDYKCGSDNGSGGIKPQLTCYPQTDIDNTNAVIKSLSAI